MSTSAKFIERYGIDSPAQREAAQRSHETIERDEIEVARLVWPEQHGLLRGRALMKHAYLASLESGTEITMAPFFFDPANGIVLNP